MPLDGASPRVTLGIATYNRHDYLAEAIRSALDQDFDDLEVLVVLDGTTNPQTDEVLAAFADEPRLRVVRHDRNRGIAAAYNTFVSEGRGELIAMIGDDDVCLPGRIRRQVEIFDRHPDTGVVHGDAIVIDADGPSDRRVAERGLHAGRRSCSRSSAATTTSSTRRGWCTAACTRPSAATTTATRWPTTSTSCCARRASSASVTSPAARSSAIRRHGANTSDESARARELDDVERALEAAIDLYPLRELVPELDWAVLDPADAERQALMRLADALEQRLLPRPGLAAKLRARAAADAPVRAAAAPRPRPAGGC